MSRKSGTCHRCGLRYRAVKIHWYDVEGGRVGQVMCPFCDHLDQIVEEIDG